jgi:hypothetical protein
LFICEQSHVFNHNLFNGSCEVILPRPSQEFTDYVLGNTKEQL